MRTTAAILALAMLPSLTRLSESYQLAWPAAARLTGPLNLMKLALPFLLYQVWQTRKSFIKTRWARATGAALLIGTAATLIAAIPCDFQPALLREWLVILTGCLAAFAFWGLNHKLQKRVVLSWCALVAGSALLDALAPGITDWFYANLFDPWTRALDEGELGGRVLTGIYGRQSLAKLLAWLPPLALAVCSQKKRPPKTQLIAWGVFWAVCAGATLATSQRGPLLAAISGMAAFAIHQAVKEKKKEVAMTALAGVILTGILTVAFVPRAMWVGRLSSLLPFETADQSDPAVAAQRHQADENSLFRRKMTAYTLEIIATHPLGHACISMDEYLAHGVGHFSHAHNLILEQFRARGWLWGLAHLALWVWAAICAWRAPGFSGSALFAAVTTILVSGLFDHPWFPLNHAVVLWTALLGAIRLPQSRAPRSASSSK